MHDKLETAAEEVENKPNWHGSHIAEVVAPITEENFPAPQAAHVTDSSASAASTENVPASHFIQLP